MSIGIVLETLSQQILVGIILVGGLGVDRQAARHGRSFCPHPETHCYSAARGTRCNNRLKQNFLVMCVRFGSPKESCQLDPLQPYLKQDTSISPLGTIAHVTRRF